MSTWEIIPLAAFLASTTVAGLTWQQFRIRSERRFRAVLDAYAEREIRREQHRVALKSVRISPRPWVSSAA